MTLNPAHRPDPRASRPGSAPNSRWAWRLGARRPFFVVGDPGISTTGVPVRTIAAPSEAAHVALSGPARSCPIPSRPRRPGTPDPANAHAVIAAIARAVDLVMRGEASALTTGPIHKKALIDGAGFAYPGHTEYLAHLAGVDRVVMMLAGPTSAWCRSRSTSR
jgi:4-hydroxythreonine-4-phosphate dehydrogenase